MMEAFGFVVGAALFLSLYACFVQRPRVDDLTEVINTISSLVRDAQAKLTEAQGLKRRSEKEMRDAQNIFAHAQALYAETNARKADK